MLEHSPLEAVYIYFDTATYDEIQRDEKVNFLNSYLFSVHKLNADICKVTLEAQLGLIGGTMGLLTGFSILSGVEIIYYLFRFIIRYRPEEIFGESERVGESQRQSNHLLFCPD